MLHAKAIALASGHKRIRWGVESDNHAAIRFYQRLGATLHTKGICTWEVEITAAHTPHGSSPG
jgi:hypothetical protein